MKNETFDKFWNACFLTWMERTTVQAHAAGSVVDVKSLCRFTDTAFDDVFSAYNRVKKIAKDIYFKNKDSRGEYVHLNRYKRAAVMTYAVLLADPLALTSSDETVCLDCYFLKQRLAFFVGLQSIVQDFPQNKVREKLGTAGKVFFFDELGKRDTHKDEDSFEMSIYKDLLFAELHNNYNILTMANVYGLLTERASILADIDPIYH